MSCQECGAEPLQPHKETCSAYQDHSANVMRHEYRTLTNDEKLQMREVKDLGLRFHDLCAVIGTSRELSLAKTKIEEAVMWAVKHITK